MSMTATAYEILAGAFLGTCALAGYLAAGLLYF